MTIRALQDPRMIDVLGVALGIDMQGFAGPEGSDELRPDVSPQTQSTPPPATSSKSDPEPTPAPHPAEEDVEMTEEDDEEAKAKKEALAAKEAGGVAYKAKNFGEAATFYQKAWDLWPKDLTFLTNLSGASHAPLPQQTSTNSLLAVYFEQGDYDKALETCEKAVEEGREVNLVIFSF